MHNIHFRNGSLQVTSHLVTEPKKQLYCRGGLNSIFGKISQPILLDQVPILQEFYKDLGKFQQPTPAIRPTSTIIHRRVGLNINKTHMLN